MKKQNPLVAFVTFCKDLPHAAFVCHAYMIFALFAIVYTCKYLVKVMEISPRINHENAISFLMVECLIMWFIAFTSGVLKRPMSPNDYIEYPPVKMLSGAWACGFIFVLGSGIIFGYLVDIGILASLVSSFLGMLATILYLIFVFIIWTNKTMQGAKRLGDKTVMIADSYHRSWWFSGSIIAAICISLQLIGGESGVANIYNTGLHGSLILGIFLTGFASGYYP